MTDWTLPGTETVLLNVHEENGRCRMSGCVIHNPDMLSPMNADKWPYRWNFVLQAIQRLCPHGCFHPDVDSEKFHERMGSTERLVHECDGCCGGKYSEHF